jgi:hypothetical protein
VISGEGSKTAMDARLLDPSKVSENYTIFKYPFFIADTVEITLPRGARIMHIAQQPLAAGDLQLWAHIDKRAPMAQRVLKVYGTGHPMPAQPGPFLGTVFVHGGALVFHIYDGGEVR